MAKQNRNIIFTTIAIEAETDKLIEKLCKRYSLKKGEITKLAFLYLDKAHINPADAPESVKSELSKINKRQDDVIRFIRKYEEDQLNPMIRTSHSIAVRFDSSVKEQKELITSEINTSRELQDNVLKKITETFNKLLKLISLYSELATCGVMDGKRKENLRNEINDLINE